MRPVTFIAQTEIKNKVSVHPILALAIVLFWAGLASAVFFAQATSPDFQAPEYLGPTVKAAVDDATNSITLTWTAPGDDGNTGQATAYQIRYNTTAISEASWALATPLANPPTPKPAGQTESLLVANLQPNQNYYFALKTSDEAGNLSAISNIASKKTAAVSFPLCVENWTCTAWTACTDGQQTRTCTDQAACGTQTNQPTQSRSCSVDQPMDQNADSVAPNSAITAAPTATQTRPTFTFTWTGLDDVTAAENLSFSFRLDNLGWSNWTTQTSIVIDNLKNGEHTFYVRSRDQAGNIDPSVASVSFTVRLNTFLVAAVERGSAPTIRVQDFNGVLQKEFSAFETSFRNGMQVVAGDLGKDGQSEIVVAPNGGRQGQVKIFRPDGSLVATFLPYGPAYRDGVNLALADVNGDNSAEIIVAKQRGTPNVRIFGFRQSRYTQIYREFNAEASGYRNGISLAGGDLNADGRDEIITAPAGTGSRMLRIFRLQGTGLRQIAAKNNILDSANSGLEITTADLAGDNTAEIIVGPLRNYAPIVRVFALRGTNIVKLRPDYRAFRTVERAGVRLSAADFDYDGKADFLASYGGTVQPKITVFKSTNFSRLGVLNFFSTRDRLILSHASGTQ
ncbi:hypothetical protein C4546_04885 [Candidatus Parcubacteria bacterium]|jgi:hypothetical protein|nr:MAG: hypothetical protein C4546_04885 [Candidatus Parcubacteria bacterium]